MKTVIKTLMTSLVLSLVLNVTVVSDASAKGWGIGKHIKATFGNKKAKKEIAQKRASKYKKKAEKSCAKGKTRACERHKRKAAGNEAMAKTGKNSTKRQVKRSLRQTRRGEKACSKGKQRKCDRLTRKAAFNNCKATGNNKKDCRKAKRSLREDQKAYRKGLSDENVTAGVRQQNLANRDARYGALGIGAGAAAMALANRGRGFPGGPQAMGVPAFQLTESGCRPANVPAYAIDGEAYFKTQSDCQMARGQFMAQMCQSQGGMWNGYQCQYGGMGTRSPANTYNKASRFVPVQNGGMAGRGASAKPRTIIKRNTNYNGSQRQINTFGKQINNNSQAVSGSLGNQ